MNHLSRFWRRPVARVLVLALAVAFSPLPALAGQPPAPTPSPNLQLAIQKAVATERLAASPVAAVQAQQSGGVDKKSASFFKSPVGIVVIATLAVGAGYAVYSAKHDRIISPAKK